MPDTKKFASGASGVVVVVITSSATPSSARCVAYANAKRSLRPRSSRPKNGATSATRWRPVPFTTIAAAARRRSNSRRAAISATATPTTSQYAVATFGKKNRSSNVWCAASATVAPSAPTTSGRRTALRPSVAIVTANVASVTSKPMMPCSAKLCR